MDSEAYGFGLEWFDRQANLIREYTLTAFVPHTGPLEVAMYDVKSHRPFLKRTVYPELKLEELQVGSIVTIHARQLKVVKYNDDRTRMALEVMHAGVCFITTPDLFQHFGQLVETLESAKLRLAKLRLVNDNGPVFAAQVTGENAEKRFDAIAKQIPGDGCYLQKVTVQQLERYFDRAQFPSTAAFNNCSLCVVRPHAVKDGGVGVALAAVMESGLEVAAVEMLALSRAEAAELHDVYKGVLPYYADLVDGASSGPCVCLELRAPEGVCEKLRELCGPHDLDMAKHLRPKSLRALLGKSNAENGVHATDLEEDGEREVSYVFDTLLSNLGK